MHCKYLFGTSSRVLIGNFYLTEMVLLNCKRNLCVLLTVSAYAKLLKLNISVIGKVMKRPDHQQNVQFSLIKTLEEMSMMIVKLNIYQASLP